MQERRFQSLGRGDLLEKEIATHSSTVIVIPSCLTLCDPMDCMQSATLLCPGCFPGKNSGVGCHFLLQGIFPAQGLNLPLLHWQVDSLLSKPTGKPSILAWEIPWTEEPWDRKECQDSATEEQQMPVKQPSSDI